MRQMIRGPVVSSTVVETSKSANGIWIRISGPGTFRIAPALQNFVREQFTEVIGDVYVDLSGCSWLDSTCTGSLVGMLRRSSGGGQPRFHLNNPSSACVESLRRMHLDTLFHIESPPIPEQVEWQALVEEQVSDGQTAELVIEAHQQLASADPRNENFARIAEAFKADAARRS